MRTESRVPSASLAEGDRRTPDTQRHVSIWNSCQAHKRSRALQEESSGQVAEGDEELFHTTATQVVVEVLPGSS